AVAARQVPYLYRGGGTARLPHGRWREHGANYWAITIENQTAGERYNGAGWRFDTPSDTVPVDTVEVTPFDYGYSVISPAKTFCTGAELVSGASYRTYMNWALTVYSNTLRLAGARWKMSSTATSVDSLAKGVAIWGTTSTPSC